MNTYSLIAPDGQSYGPVDENGLIQWARERRVAANSQLRCMETGVVVLAGSLPCLSSILNAPPTLAVPSYAPVGNLPVGSHRLTEFPVALAVLLHFITLGIFSMIRFNLMHGQLPKVRPDDPSAGKAIGFMFIPFFNFYWIFFSYNRLCLRIDEQRIQRGLPPKNMRGLSIAMCTTIVIPYVGLCVGFPIMAPIFFGMTQSSVNELIVAGSVPRV